MKEPKFPAHLAERAVALLERDHGVSVDLAVLEAICTALYFASLKTEEAEPIGTSITFFDGPDLERYEQEGGGAGSWSLTRFGRRLPLGVEELVKLAQAIDPMFGTIAVAEDEQGLFFLGATDQEIAYHRTMAGDDQELTRHAGTYHVTINSPGSLSVYVDDAILATLSHGELIDKFHRVLQEGLVAERIVEGLDRLDPQVYFVAAAERLLPGVELRGYEALFPKLAKVELVRVIARLLARIQRYGHGGALLLIADGLDGPDDGLDVKYPFRYGALFGALLDSVTHRIFELVLLHEIAEAAGDGVPGALLVRVAENARRLQLANRGLEGAIAFLASQSRVDGLILIDGAFDVVGFGTRIVRQEPVQEVHIAGGPQAKAGGLSPRRADGFGNRHRSIFDYVASHPSALGFVVSQDRDVRAVLNADGQVVVWQNIRLQGKDGPLAAAVQKSLKDKAQKLRAQILGYQNQ